MPTIEKAEKGQIDALTEMWHEFMEYHRNLREWAYSLEEDASEAIRKRFHTYIDGDTKQVLIVTDDEDDPVGFAVARIEEASEIFSVGPKARITDFYLRPKARGRNIGRQMVEHISNWARKQGAEKLFMSIDANNDAGRQFWEALDFQQTKETYLTDL